MHRPKPFLLAAIVLALIGCGIGCGIDEDVVAREAAEAAPPSTSATETTTATSTTAPGTEEASDGDDGSSPFAVAEVPAGYDLQVAGTGEAEPGDDDRPVTVLAPDGDPVGTGVVFVETVRDDGDDGFVPDDEDSRWASLTDDGVRVWGIEATEDELDEVAEAATPATDPGRAPVVEEPPAGLEVVGSIDADGVLGLVAGVPADDEGPVPGPASAHAAVWADDSSSLVVLTLSGDALDPAAVVTEVREPRRRVDEERDAVAQGVAVGEVTGVVTTTADAASSAVVRRELAVGTAWGDILVIVSRGDDILDAEDLVALAESTTEATDAEWEEFAG